MLVVPTVATPSQALTVLLGGQSCSIKIFQKSTGMYLNLSVSDTPIVSGAICLDGVRIVRDAYLGFVGDLAFFDTQGDNDPTYDGLGVRYFLIYLEASDIAGDV